jgi:hypothetical protein
VLIKNHFYKLKYVQDKSEAPERFFRRGKQGESNTEVFDQLRGY